MINPNFMKIMNNNLLNHLFNNIPVKLQDFIFSSRILEIHASVLKDLSENYEKTDELNAGVQ